MKTIKFFIGITILTLISCQTEEIERNQNTELLSAEIKELSIFKLAAQMNNLTLNEKLSNSEKVRLREFSQSIISDLKTFELNKSEIQYQNTASAKSSFCLASSICGYQYNQCPQWATFWNDLLRSCNGPVENRPNNCDQIREDYINNLDKIESTYNKCSAKLNTCIARYCSEDDGGFGEHPL